MCKCDLNFYISGTEKLDGVINVTSLSWLKQFMCFLWAWEISIELPVVAVEAVPIVIHLIIFFNYRCLCKHLLLNALIIIRCVCLLCF